MKKKSWGTIEKILVSSNRPPLRDKAIKNRGNRTRFCDFAKTTTQAFFRKIANFRKFRSKTGAATEEFFYKIKNIKNRPQKCVWKNSFRGFSSLIEIRKTPSFQHCASSCGFPTENYDFFIYAPP